MAKKPKKLPKTKRRKKKTGPPSKAVFESRRREREVESPAGFDIRLGNMTQDEAYAVILARLEDAKLRLPDGYEGRIIIHPYADGSVDGELYVKVPEDGDTRNTEFDLYDAFAPVAVGIRYWVSAGVRYAVKTDDERYKRYKGMTQVQTNYQRANQPNIVEEHLILRKTIIQGMERTFGEEAHSVFIRLHWNPQNTQPKR